MLIEYLLDVGEDSAEAGLLRTDPNAFYQAARRIFDSDPGFAERARKRVVDLQGGDPGTLQLWQEIVDLSLDYLHRIYGRLGVTLTDDDIKGESFYNHLLADTAARAGGKRHRGLQRRRALRVPAGLHRPRGQAVARHHPQERRRLQLLHHRSGHHPVPRRRAPHRPGDLRGRVGSGAALPDGVRGRQAGGLDTRGHPLRACPDRPGPRPGRQPAPDEVPETTSSSATCCRRPSTARAASWSSSTPRHVSIPPSLTRSPRPSASARSSTPTCRPRGKARTSSTGTG